MAIYLNLTELRSVFFYCFKKFYDLKDFYDIETLVVGSSHGDYSFNPIFHENSFNLCTSSQDLFQSRELIKFCRSSHKKLRNIVLYYSIFSPGFDVSKSKSSFLFELTLNRVFGIGRNLLLPNAVEDTINKIFREFERGPSNSSRGFYTNLRKLKIDADPTERIVKHLDFHRSRSMLRHLEAILLDNVEINIFAVIAPVRYDYYMKLPPEIHYEIIEYFKNLVSKHSNLYIIDALKTQISSAIHFLDSDHINPKGEGPKILTELIGSKIAIASLVSSPQTRYMTSDF